MIRIRRSELFTVAAWTAFWALLAGLVLGACFAPAINGVVNTMNTGVTGLTMLGRDLWGYVALFATGTVWPWMVSTWQQSRLVAISDLLEWWSIILLVFASFVGAFVVLRWLWRGIQFFGIFALLVFFMTSALLWGLLRRAVELFRFPDEGWEGVVMSVVGAFGALATVAAAVLILARFIFDWPTVGVLAYLVMAAAAMTALTIIVMALVVAVLWWLGEKFVRLARRYPWHVTFTVLLLAAMFAAWGYFGSRPATVVNAASNPVVVTATPAPASEVTVTPVTQIGEAYSAVRAEPVTKIGEAYYAERPETVVVTEQVKAQVVGMPYSAKKVGSVQSVIVASYDAETYWATIKLGSIANPLEYTCGSGRPFISIWDTYFAVNCKAPTTEMVQEVLLHSGLTSLQDLMAGAYIQIPWPSK